MGSRPKRPKIEVPKPVVYQTQVPEEDFDRADEYISYLDDSRDKLIATENLTLGNKEKRAYDNLVNRQFELGAYIGSLPADQEGTGFQIDKDIRGAFDTAFDKTTEDVDRARDVFEETTQGGGDKPGIDGPFNPGGGGGGGGSQSKGLADYKKFLRTYDHTARGKGSKRDVARFSGLDVRFVKDAAEDYNISDEERNKAIRSAVEQYKKDDVKMGGATRGALRELDGRRGDDGGRDKRDKKDKRKKAKKKAERRRKRRDRKRRRRFAANASGKSRFQRRGMSTGRPGGG